MCWSLIHVLVVSVHEEYRLRNNAKLLGLKINCCSSPCVILAIRKERMEYGWKNDGDKDVAAHQSDGVIIICI